jgi:hypothetical protein
MRRRSNGSGLDIGAGKTGSTAGELAASLSFNFKGDFLMAKYSIRQPFAIHLDKVTERPGPDGKPIRTKNVDSHFAGESIELTDAQALAHLHKIESADGAAKQFLDAYHAEQAKNIAARVATTGPSLAQEVSAAVVAALAAAGVIDVKASRARA